MIMESICDPHLAYKKLEYIQMLCHHKLWVLEEAKLEST